MLLFYQCNKYLIAQVSFEIRFMFGMPQKSTGVLLRKKRLFSYQLGGSLCPFVSC